MPFIFINGKQTVDRMNLDKSAHRVLVEPDRSPISCL